MAVLQRPPANARNAHYLTNRPPLKAGALVKLPIHGMFAADEDARVGYSDPRQAIEAIVAEGIPVRIEETTRYPFEEQVSLEIHPETTATFPLYLRVPSWSDRSIAIVNGAVVAENVSPSTDVQVCRAWAPGDEVEIRLPMDVTVRRWHANHHSVSVDRGPLAYSLKIGTKTFDVTPIETVAIDSQWRGVVDREAGPAHELQPTTPWNYGLVLDKRPAEENFEVEELGWPDDDCPFAPG